MLQEHNGTRIKKPDALDGNLPRQLSPLSRTVTAGPYLALPTALRGVSVGIDVFLWARTFFEFSL